MCFEPCQPLKTNSRLFHSWLGTTTWIVTRCQWRSGVQKAVSSLIHLQCSMEWGIKYAESVQDLSNIGWGIKRFTDALQTSKISEWRSLMKTSVGQKYCNTAGFTQAFCEDCQSVWRSAKLHSHKHTYVTLFFPSPLPPTNFHTQSLKSYNYIPGTSCGGKQG